MSVPSSRSDRACENKSTKNNIRSNTIVAGNGRIVSLSGLVRSGDVALGVGRSEAGDVGRGVGGHVVQLVDRRAEHVVQHGE